MAVDVLSTIEVMGGECSLPPSHDTVLIGQNIIDGAQTTRLRDAYPHIESPTLAQEALLKALDGNKDIFLRDKMGRGK